MTNQNMRVRSPPLLLIISRSQKQLNILHLGKDHKSGLFLFRKSGGKHAKRNDKH